MGLRLAIRILPGAVNARVALIYALRRIASYRAVGLLLLAILLLAAPPASANNVENSRFYRTVEYLVNSTAELQAVFAGVALSELAEVYMAEADLARFEAEQSPDSEKLLGWSRAVDQYASQLLLLLEDIEQGFPVAVVHGEQGPARVTIAGRSVIIGHPRLGQQAAFERRVLQEFCARQNCDRLTVTDTAPVPIPMSASQVKPGWTFTEQGPVCFHGGLELQFRTANKLPQLRSLCTQFLQEALSLANEIAWQRRHGVIVNWSAMRIRPTPGRPQHVVQLNDAQDSILATLPLLYGSPGLLEDIRPWLQNSHSDSPPVTLRLQANRYGWEQDGSQG